jgi:hypothetical protein
MNVNRLIYIRDQDVVKTFQIFLSRLWQQLDLAAVLTPAVQFPQLPGIPAMIDTQVIDNPDAIARVDPFAPTMVTNAASEIGSLIKNYPGKRIAAILRSCELRTLVELQKRHRLPVNQPTQPRSDACVAAKDGLLIIGVDCPGTYTLDSYTHLVSPDNPNAALKAALFSDHCGTVASTTTVTYTAVPFRAACQTCEWPATSGADVTIGTLGVAPLDYLLVIARDEETDARLNLAHLTDRLATEEEVIQREYRLASVMNQRTAAPPGSFSTLYIMWRLSGCLSFV